MLFYLNLIYPIKNPAPVFSAGSKLCYFVLDNSPDMIYNEATTSKERTPTMKTKRILSTLLAGLLTASALLSGTVINTAAAEVTAAAQDYVTVAQPVTNIVGDIAVIREINSKAEMDALAAAETKPATALYTINQDLQVLDTAGNLFATLDEVLTAHDYRILPGFRFSTKAESDALIAYLNGLGFYDCMLVSADTALMKTTREALPTAFGVIDYTETYKDVTALTTEQCLDLRRSLKTYNGNVALLPAHLCTKDTVQYLFEHQVNVWMQISDQPTVAEQYNALLSGAVGVISDATDSLLDIACNQLPEYTLTRTPLNVGHRGIPTLAPECTVEGSVLAYEQSANVVEMDVFLTADGRVAAMHDITTGDTCNANIHMEDSTLAQLKELYVNRGWENNAKYSQLRIPTLDEYMEAFKDTDCMLFIEIKSHKPEIVPIIRDMVNEYDMYDQCAVITFNTDTMEYMREEWPEMALGVLCEDYYYFMTGPIPEQDLRTAMEFVGPHNGTINPGYEAYDRQDIRAFMIRGISVNPWTFYGSDEYMAHFLDGFASLTGNDANVIKRLTQRVSYKVRSTEVETGDSLELKLSVTPYSHTTTNQKATVVSVLAGEELVEIADGQMTFVGESGEVTFVLGYTDRTLDYTVFTQPITVRIASEEETTLPETEPRGTEPATNEDTTAEQNTAEETDPAEGGCSSMVSGLALMVPVAVAVVLVGWKKKDE